MMEPTPAEDSGFVKRMLGKLGKIFGRAAKTPDLPKFPGRVIRGWDEWIAHRDAMEPEYDRRRKIEHALISASAEEFEVEGFCAVCAAARRFRVKYDFASEHTDDGRLVPNWREHLVCQCNLSNRVRASMHLFLQEFGKSKNAGIYITEQTTELFRWFKSRYPGTVGSEYFGSDAAPGSAHGDFRHEDLMHLSFPDNSFDALLSFEVLEHVGDSKASFSECLRVLRPGGVMVFTAPFTINQQRNTVRAIAHSDGSVEHLAPPEYHGNPIDPEAGSLCFRYFGWELLDELKELGFHDPRAVLYWSREMGYLGVEQLLLLANKPLR